MIHAIAALLLAQVSVTVPAQAEHAIPSFDDTVARIAQNDARLFWGFFEGCKPDAVADLVHPDFRMLHDIAGLALASGEQMIEQSRERCASRAPGGANAGYKNRRLLVPGSRRVQMLGDWGALEEGSHTFHEWRGPDAGWVQTGGGRYIHSWQWMPVEGRYRLLESLSIDHGPAPEYPPQAD